jgi:outer membrane usher protein
MSPCRNRGRTELLFLFLRMTVVACCASSLPPTAAQTSGMETGERVLPVEVTINKGTGGIWPIVSRDGVLYAPVEAFAQWRMQVRPDTATIDYRGFRYYPVTAVPGLQARLDPDSGILELTGGAESFAATRLTRELSSVLPRTPAVPAVFVNYDLNLTHSAARVSSSRLGLLGEIGTSGAWGVFTQTFVAPDLLDTASHREVVRLETTYRRDFPDQGHTLSLGDGVFRTGLLGRNAYFGGVQFGTNFSLAPYISRTPVPLIAGETSTPSTVQLYVNDVLRQTTNVPAGPFTLENLPVLSGNGEVSVRVRDILGRETVITQPFLVTGELLAPGINDWSVEAGKLRLDLGSESSHYGQAFAAGMLRRGLGFTTTGEARLEVTRTRRGVGLAAVQAFGSSWMLRGGAMASHDEALGHGSRWLLGVDHPDYSGSFSATLEANTRAFRTLGDDASHVPVKLQFAAQASWALQWGRVGTAFALQRLYDQASVATYSVNYSTTLRHNWHLNAYYTRALGSAASGYTIGALLTVPIDRHTHSASSVQHQNRRTEFYTSVTHTPAATTGWAWRALAAQQGERRVEGGVNYLSQRGLFTGEISARRDTTDLRLGAVGGVLWTQNRLFATPRFDRSAALVEVPGYANVGVGLGAQTGLATDADGVVLVNRLLPYQKNPIRLDANDLPLTAEIDSIEYEAVPPWRSVSKVKFAVRGGRAALLTITLDDGEPAPAGATVSIEGEDRDFLVARRGEAYVTGLKESNRLQLQWQGQVCSLHVPLGAHADADIARVGPLRCQGVAR